MIQKNIETGGGYQATVSGMYGEFAEALFNYTNVLWNKRQTEQIIKVVESLNSSNYSLYRELIKYVKDIQHRHEINRMHALGRR